VKRFLLVCLLVAACAFVAYTLGNRPHDFRERDCRRCHYSPDLEPERLRASVTELCGNCHMETIETVTHPFDVTPRMAKVPLDLPLTYGKITCNTCHNVHAESPLVFGMKSYFLRRPTADKKFFCIACHEENRARPGHKELLLIAHVSSRYYVTDPGQMLDTLSADCISCHDGTVGSDTAYSFGGGYWAHPDSSHPIGVSYRDASMRKGLTPVGLLDKRLRLFDGKVGCGTCHDMFSSEPKKLAVNNSGSKLCMLCHSDK